jgi:hypothetical protein
MRLSLIGSQIIKPEEVTQLLSDENASILKAKAECIMKFHEFSEQLRILRVSQNVYA